MPGHGGNEEKEHLQEYCLSNYAEVVRDVMEIIKENMEIHYDLRGVKPFLLGDSMAGVVVQ